MQVRLKFRDSPVEKTVRKTTQSFQNIKTATVKYRTVPKQWMALNFSFRNLSL